MKKCIYNNETFNVELTINEHKESIYDLIQLKNEILVSCSYYDKKMNMYQLENNNYKLLSQIDVDMPKKLIELENGEMGLIVSDSIIFYLILNNKFDEDFNIERKLHNGKYYGEYFDMIAIKPGELAICEFINLGTGGNSSEILFFELKSRKLKESININRSFNYHPSNVLCMMNERCLCVGGSDKITIIDVNQKSIIREIEDKGSIYALYKLNDNILLSGNYMNIT